mmetsp:Transcript_60369/g.148505  ORF Transcript_60369/g.148505 Transcript_60369/m.148505 type:complete len:245 (+) Transcript_60369:249-983(+)
MARQSNRPCRRHSQEPPPSLPTVDKGCPVRNTRLRSTRQCARAASKGLVGRWAGWLVGRCLAQLSGARSLLPPHPGAQTVKHKQARTCHLEGPVGEGAQLSTARSLPPPHPPDPGAQTASRPSQASRPSSSSAAREPFQASPSPQGRARTGGCRRREPPRARASPSEFPSRGWGLYSACAPEAAQACPQRYGPTPPEQCRRAEGWEADSTAPCWAGPPRAAAAASAPHPPRPPPRGRPRSGACG